MTQTTIDYSKMTPAQMLVAIQALQQANERLTAQRTAKISWRVSQKGAISVYGMGRFPMTLHPSQWDALFSVAGDLKAFVEENRVVCDQQSTVWEATTDEAKAKGIPEAKLEAHVKATLFAAKNPFVSAPSVAN